MKHILLAIVCAVAIKNVSAQRRRPGAADVAPESYGQRDLNNWKSDSGVRSSRSWNFFVDETQELPLKGRASVTWAFDGPEQSNCQTKTTSNGGRQWDQYGALAGINRFFFKKRGNGWSVEPNWAFQGKYPQVGGCLPLCYRLSPIKAGDSGRDYEVPKESVTVRVYDQCASGPWCDADPDMNRPSTTTANPGSDPSWRINSKTFVHFNLLEPSLPKGHSWSQMEGSALQMLVRFTRIDCSQHGPSKTLALNGTQTN